jgi:carbonic anhydrase
MTALDEILNANAAYANQFDKAGLPAAPGLKLAIVTCMDGRIETGRAFGLAEGDAHVIRNAGGRMSEALRSIIISQVLLGTDAVAVVHHTECGMLSFTDESLRKQIRESGADADAIAFLPFSDLEQSVRDDVALYHGSPLVRHDVPVRGFIFDLKTGALNEVV